MSALFQCWWKFNSNGGFSIFLYLLLYLIVSPPTLVYGGLQCHNQSLLSLSEFSINPTQIICRPKSTASFFCSITLFKPQSVTCTKDSSIKLEDPSVVESVLEQWDCYARPEWAGEPELRCPHGISTCEDSMERCFAFYDPLHIMTTLLLVFLLALLVLACFVGIFYVRVINPHAFTEVDDGDYDEESMMEVQHDNEQQQQQPMVNFTFWQKRKRH